MFFYLLASARMERLVHFICNPEQQNIIQFVKTFFSNTILHFDLSNRNFINEINQFKQLTSRKNVVALIDYITGCSEIRMTLGYLPIVSPLVSRSIKLVKQSTFNFDSSSKCPEGSRLQNPIFPFTLYLLGNQAILRESLSCLENELLRPPEIKCQE